MSSVKKNFSYNIIYQILTLILPLITAPYISRVIGAGGTGIYSYTSSIVQYFILFAMLGMNNYGNRTIAKCRDDKDELSKKFSSLYIFQLITSTLMVILYIGYICLFNNQYLEASLIQLIYLISTCFDISWFFFGLEKFKLTVIRNTIIKILSATSIFIFVKNKDDLMIYITLMSVSHLLSQLSLWPFLKSEVKLVKPKIKDIMSHLKPNLILFIPVIAVSLYKIMDKIMLGNMATIQDVGYYEYAEKIINIPLSIITALGTVMLPRISNLVANNNQEKIKFYIDKSMQFVLFISIAMCFGIIAISPRFVPIFLGDEFVQTGYILQLLSVTIIFISWANVIRTQYLIPNEEDKPYIISVFIGAIINFVVNILLIPRYKTIGAAIGTICAEISVAIYQTIVVRKEIDFRKYIKYIVQFILSGLIMYIIISNLSHIIHNSYLLIISQVTLGAIIYSMLNYKIILENIKYIPFLNKIRKRKINEKT